MSVGENLEIEAILRHCGVKDDQLKTKVDSCKNEILKLRGSGSSRLINDAIHGPIELSPLMYKIINTPQFHRLKDIKQLGGANYVYPGANHTRFDHSIGVFHLAGEFARHLQRQAKSDFPNKMEGNKFALFTDEEVMCVEIAGLCHDLGHGPFSHLFQHYVMKWKHEDLSVSIFRTLVAENIHVLAELIGRQNLKFGLAEFKLIEYMIRPPKPPGKLPEPWKNKEFLCEIVANKSTGVDVDKWDYYARDCHYLGVTSDFQERRCMLLGRIVEDEGEFHIAFRDKELDNIYGMFRTRAILHQKAYQHKTIKAVERMITDAIIKILDIPIIQVPGSDTAVSINTAVQQAGDGEVEAYLALTDSITEIIKYIPRSVLSEPNLTDKQTHLEEAKEILRRIERRDLYHCSGRVRIPKKEDNLWHSLMAMTIQPEGESIHEFLEQEKKQAIMKSQLWVPIETIQLPSEEKDNPIDEIRFYKKPSDDSNAVEILTKKEVQGMTSLLVVPEAFVECEVRLYDKRKAKDRKNGDQEALKDALVKWKEYAEEKHNGASPEHGGAGSERDAVGATSELDE